MRQSCGCSEAVGLEPVFPIPRVHGYPYNWAKETDTQISVQLALLLYCTDMSANHTTDQRQPFRVYSASTLGAAIRHYRNSLGITQKELAARAGMPRNYVNALENGLETEQLKRTLAVLRELGVRMTLDREDW